MPPFDGKAMAADVLAAVRDYTARYFLAAVKPLHARLAELEEFRQKAFVDKPIGQAEIDAIIREAIAAVPVPKDGEPGKPGKDGEPGKDADPQAVAALLRSWIIEEAATVKPKDGAPGRDAAQLEIAAAIDPERTYPRGTYAKHANGLWRAYEQTQGMRGWECLVAGVAEVEVLCTHEREFKVVHTLSDGKEFAQTFELPVAIYRGVFVDGREYHRGDQVSWGAHQWHCNEQTTEKPIEGGKAWTLAVKRGRDGKEGPPGPPGKDRVVVKEKA